MRVTFVIASPKVQKSTSGQIATLLKGYIDNTEEIHEIKLCSLALTQEQKAILKASDQTVFLFPLYVDGIPGHLLSCLVQIDEEKIMKPSSLVYGVVNCGLYEGTQTEPALNVLENWCNKTGVSWGGGLGIGGGGALAYMPIVDSKHGPMANICARLGVFAEKLKAGNVIANQYTQIQFPRFLYKIGGEIGWRQMAKSNKLKWSDLSKKID